MRVPDFGALRHDGARVTLYGMAAERPVAMVFLRHLGCIFCRQQVAMLRDAMPEENVVFVTMSPPKVAARFRTWMRSPHPFLCDPERRLYEAFDVPRSTVGKYFSSTVVKAALRAYRSGYRNALDFDDQLQLGGTFVIDRAGDVLGSFVSEDIADAPAPETILALLHAPDPIYAEPYLV